MSEEKKEELKEEIVTDEIDNIADCDGNCAACSEDCFGDFEFEPIHKTWSFANVLSLSCKVIGLVYFLVSIYVYIKSVVEYQAGYGELPMGIVEIILSFFDQFGLTTVVFLGVGEVVNLINRIKESIMY